ncbi:MAG: hypothetical protein DRI61_13105 [Chloroflexi bacterium]|nr:MAG: hypothetical protein DRI61_13105 [Chloroflexota bacterium]HDN80697.1 CPBP family intramembrane metalloprotease [Chloroflexota bacterium]
MLILLSVWLVANFAPHILVFFVKKKICYQLNTMWIMLTESSIMLLNLLLPVLVLLPRKDHIFQGLGWRWGGWHTMWIGLIGFVVFIAIALVSQRTIGAPLSSSGRQISSHEFIMTSTLLLVLTPAAEETMFRGYIQTALTRSYGVWIGIGGTALLFGLRHLPMDLYNGIVQRAPSSAWLSRMLQLYIGALLFGIVRHWAGSTWASWIMHESIMMVIVGLNSRSLCKEGVSPQSLRGG